MYNVIKNIITFRFFFKFFETRSAVVQAGLDFRSICFQPSNAGEGQNYSEGDASLVHIDSDSNLSILGRSVFTEFISAVW